MEFSDYKEMPPKVGESATEYCARLEQDGFEEMFMRKALAYHLHMRGEEFGSFFNKFEQARLRHLTMLSRMAPKRSEFSFAKKVSKNLGISEQLASLWVTRFGEVGDVEYVGMNAAKSVPE
ncbi:hypothetical protein [uncultured Ruegeria sp.]|jgi:hypothetical protein|uniref:hypothetical protein n=1 Tax=uncultured Ruegeria sp. TaxID=259304 RepID=UPI00262E1860|nr:hypothetical protein [uncultured Ruegeria sp.]